MLGTSCTESSIHPVQHTLSTAYSEYCIHRIQHPPSTAYTKYSIQYVQHLWSTAYTKHSIHIVPYAQGTAYSMYFIIIRSSNFLVIASRFPLCVLFCTELSTVPWIWVNQYLETQLQSCLPSTGSKCICILAWSQPPSSHYQSLQVYLHSC